jgi:hypothetical protein
MLKVSWRTTSDMAKPQFSEPSAPNYTTVEASNGARLEYWIERLNVRLWVNTLLIRVGRGFLRAGETLTIRLGDRRQGSPGLRLQTYCEERFELKVYVDAFVLSPGFALVPGPAVRWKAILPSLVAAGEPFRLAIVAEDLWGNLLASTTRSLSYLRGRLRTCLPALLRILRKGRARLVASRLPRPAPSSGRHHFRLLMSFRIALSNMVSASSFFSLVFSSSSAFSRLASDTSSPPNLAFHL